MRRLTIALAVAVLALAACDKKKDAAGKTGTGAGTAATGTAGAGTGTAATGPGTGAAATGAGTGTAAPGTGTGTAAAGADPAGSATLTNKAGNCPSAVLGATTAIVDDAAAAGKLVLSITAKNDAATATIRKRVAHLIEVQGAPDAEVKHSGDGTGGGGIGICPVLTTKDAKLSAVDVEGGSKVTLEPQGGATLEALRKEVEARVTKTSDWTQANITGTSTSGGGGGTGGGKGDHGGNHSGKGTGTGKEDPPPTKM